MSSESAETGDGGTLENPAALRVPKVQGASRISQAKGQSSHKKTDCNLIFQSFRKGGS